MLVAAVFVCLFVFRNELLYEIARRQILSLNLPKHKVQLSRISSEEFKLDINSTDSASSVSSRWRPKWNFISKELQLSGQIKYEEYEALAQIGIPFELTLSPVSGITLDCSGIHQSAKWSVQGKVNDIRKAWEGEARAKIEHPLWGDVSPDFYFKLGESLVLAIALEPGQIRSPWIQIKEKINVRLEKKSSSDKFHISGAIPSISPEGIPLKSLRDSVFIGSFQGEGELNQKSKFVYSIRAQVKDQQKSISIPVAVRGVNQDARFSSQLETELFQGSLAELVLKEFIPGVKLLNGMLKGELNNEQFQLFLEPTTLVFGDHLLSGLEGKANGNTKKEVLSFRDIHFVFADGVVNVQPFVLSKKNPETSLSFSVEGLQLNKILSSYPRSKLSGQGLFQGSGGLKMNSQGVFVTKLVLINSTPGVIKYSDSSQPYFEKSILYLDEFEDLLAQGQQALVLKALENFHYSSFKLEVERLSAERLKVLLNLKGKNPDLAKGQIFDITLPIEGNIDSLVKGSLFQQPVIDELHKRHIEME